MQCPYCHQVVPDSANVCGYCGQRLRQQAQPPLPASRPLPPAAPVVAPAEQVTPPAPAPSQSTPPAAAPLEPAPVQAAAPAEPAPARTKAPRPARAPRRKIPGVAWAIGGGVLGLIVVAALVVLFVLPGLGSEPAVAAPTATRPAPTATRQPTSRPIPTATSRPASGPQIPTIIEEALVNPQVVDGDPFDTLITDFWSASANVGQANVRAGMLELPESTPWQTVLLSPAFPEGRGAVLQFTVADPIYGIEIFITTGEPGTASYLRFGVATYETGVFEPTLWQESQGGPDPDGGGRLDGVLEIASDHPYGILLGVDRGGRLRVTIWDQDNPAREVRADFDGDVIWDDHEWRLGIQVDNGTLYLDDYLLVSFEGYR